MAGRVTVRVEINGEEVVLSRALEWSGGNPSWNAREFVGNAVTAVNEVTHALQILYGPDPKSVSGDLRVERPRSA